MEQVSQHKNYEPAMLDVMRDPIVQMLMDYDGVSEDDMEAFLKSAKQRDPRFVMG
jgi:hypothetical protein